MEFAYNENPDFNFGKQGKPSRCPRCMRSMEDAIKEQLQSGEPCDVRGCFFSKEIENAINKKKGLQPSNPTPHEPISQNQSWLRKNAAWFIPCIILLLLAVVVASQMMSNSKTEKNVKAKETEMLASDTVFNLTREDLVGNYSVKIESNGQLKRLTGYIDYDAIGQCTLHVLSDYEPMLFILNVNGKGMISNDDLGTTYMIHRISINKKTITFTKGNTICTLTK